MLSHYQALAFSLAIASFQIANAQAQTPPEKKAAGGHVMFTPSDIKWTEGPPTLPAGVKMAVLAGDPASKGLFTMRLMMPANYKIPPHWHPTDENVTVLSGALHMGFGDKLDTEKGMELPPGGFGVMPKAVHHYAWTTEETVIQLHAMGPWAITYVNPADDPRKKSSR